MTQNDQAAYLAEQQRAAMYPGYGEPNQAAQYFEGYARSQGSTENMGRRIVALETDNNRLRYERDEARRLARKWQRISWAQEALVLVLLLLFALIAFGGR